MQWTGSYFQAKKKPYFFFSKEILKQRKQTEALGKNILNTVRQQRRKGRCGKGGEEREKKEGSSTSSVWNAQPSSSTLTQTEMGPVPANKCLIPGGRGKLF